MSDKQAQIKAVRRWGYGARAEMDGEVYTVSSRYYNFVGRGVSWVDAFANAGPRT